MRRTPAGTSVITCILEHSSKQFEAGLEREVTVELKTTAVGEIAEILASSFPGMEIHASGFLSAKSARNRTPILHLTEIDFLEGN